MPFTLIEVRIVPLFCELEYNIVDYYSTVFPLLCNRVSLRKGSIVLSVLNLSKIYFTRNTLNYFTHCIIKYTIHSTEDSTVCCIAAARCYYEMSRAIVALQLEAICLTNQLNNYNIIIIVYIISVCTVCVYLH